MGALIVSLGGGGGASSDECTATANDILKGTRTINRNSDDEIVEGELELTGNAQAAHVLENETFYTTDAHSQQKGTMKNIGSIDGAKSVTMSGEYMYVRMSPGAHITNASSGYPEVSIPQSSIASALGVNANNILSGTSIAGVSGNIPNRGAWTGSVGVNGTTYIPAGYHNGSGYINNSQATMGGGTYTPSTSSQTIWCSGKYMTGNITFNAIPSNYVVPSVGAAFFSGGSYGVLAGGLGAYYVKSSGNQYLSSLSGLEAIISTNVEDQSVVFRTCVDVTHFKRFVANVTIHSISKNKSLWFFLSQQTGVGYNDAYYSSLGIIGSSYDIVINAPSSINTSKKWCIGFRPSGTSVIRFSINSIYAYAS